MHNKLDKKTAAIVTNEERIARFVDSDDWNAVKKTLIQKIVLNDSMSSLITDVPPERLAIEVLARAQASSLMLEWLREVEGIANQSKPDTSILTESREEQIVEYFER